MGRVNREISTNKLKKERNGRALKSPGDSDTSKTKV